MKVNQYEFPKSSFLGMPKDCALIMEKILSNKKLLKLIYYGNRDWEKQPDLTADQIKELVSSDSEKRQISILPKLYIHPEKRTYIHITFGSFYENATNPFYRDNMIHFDIYCHFDDWDLGNYELKPYRIAGELDAMLANKKLTGIGELKFVQGNPIVYDEDYAGVSISYLAIRGNEDKVDPLV